MSRRSRQIGNGAQAASSVIASLTQSTFTLVAQFAPVPWLMPLAMGLSTIVSVCDNVKVNKSAARQLAARCLDFVEVFGVARNGGPNPKIQEAAAVAQKVLSDISNRMNGWVAKDFFQSIVSQGSIADDIEACHFAITDCCNKFQIFAQIETSNWQNELAENQKRDHDQVIEYLADIKHKQEMMDDTLLKNSVMLQDIMKMMQNALVNFDEGDFHHSGLSMNLLSLQRKAGTLLPDLELAKGEVRRIGSFPVGGSAAMDIWEGMYLDEEKVAIKVLRAVNSTDKSRIRFVRERAIWAAVYKVDQGKLILPFYGFCNNDGPYPYMVSPWMPNGNAIEYVKKNPDMDHRRLIRDIAEGLRVLHTMQKPVVHGDLKGANVVIGPMGNALIADFGLYKVIEDVTGVPFTQSRGVSDSYRWFAPELCAGQGVLSLSADIYAFAMTVLELITHDQPFSYVKHTTEVVVKVSLGGSPRRPTDPTMVARGLDDNLWHLMERCWEKDRTRRPTIGDVLKVIVPWCPRDDDMTD
ncbi:hypothetical protein JAAARDRAFT_28325 [Jaapia argillacea MUCL 33604]|uniref:Protein kinase domain-containing protein n=1 Tax=Jaapia argillacea MUCL 33604 TaxID=933084 RepID=A0A067QPW7_9AGAM|nr:hypothetical protein JAAARDRAFT_28325 [Jaapia argillacea MUCL 33604]